MVKDAEWQQISNLLNLGLSVPQVSKRIGRSANTIYKLKEQNGPKLKVKGIPHISPKLVPFVEYLDGKLKKCSTNASKLFLEIEADGYQGSLSLLKQYIKERIKFLKLRNYKISKHRETGPGEEAQVDWASFGKIEINGQKEHLYAFVYVLSFSRMLYVEFTTRQTLLFLEHCHINAFNKLGIPKTILYDNMKTVVIKREINFEDTKYNQGFSDFADFNGFKIRLCHPYWPRDKGKVEAAVKYLRNHFMQGLRYRKDYFSIDELNLKVRNWLDAVASKRYHSSIKTKPCERWLLEKESLRFPNRANSYRVAPTLTRQGNKDSLIIYDGVYYSVPERFATQTVEVVEAVVDGLHTLQIYFGGLLIASHSISKEQGKFVICKKHFASKMILKSSNLKRHTFVHFNRPIEYYNNWFFGENKNV